MTNKEAIKRLETRAGHMSDLSMRALKYGGKQDIEWENEIEAIRCGIRALKDIDELSKSKEWLRTIAKEISYEKLGDYANDRYDRGFNAAIDMCASIILEALIEGERE